ncbi:MAG: energy-coupling factor ABC transporter permease [Nanoarchaeota archaeon]
MHTPDGFLTSWVCVLTFMISLSFVACSIYALRKTINKQKIILMAFLSAAIFMLQMLNFPISNATSGHFLGAGIAAILLGPSAAIVIITVVLIVQSLVYGDGGILTIGANVLNMGIVAAYATFYIYKQSDKLSTVAFSTWFGIVAASIFSALELWASNAGSFWDLIYAMGKTHMIIGICEAVITIGLFIIWKRLSSLSVKKTLNYSAFYFCICVVVLAFFLPFASNNPDGLESVALNLGFYGKETIIYPYALMQDYLADSGYIFALISGLIGAIMCYALCAASAMLIRKPS